MTQHLHIEVPESLLQRLIDRSQAEGITLNELCQRALESDVTERERGAAWEDACPPILRPGDTP